MIEKLLSATVLLGIMSSGFRLAAPYLYAALGETFGQLSGVLNLGVEGIMLLGAFASFYMVYVTGNIWLGLLAAILIGAALGLVMAFVSVTLRADQGISGIGFYLFGLGLSSLLFTKTLSAVRSINGFPALHIPVLSDLPVLGELLFRNNVLVYGAYAMIVVGWFVLEKTVLGLKIKAAGQNPAAADSLGVSVTLIRYGTVTFGGIMSAIAGASLSIGLLNIFQQNLTAGMGFIAVALVYFGGWSPWGILVGSLLFSIVNALQNWFQVLGVAIAPQLSTALPYVMAILALVFAVRKVSQPAALTKPFERGES